MVRKASNAVVAYVRVSTEEQANEGFSLRAQKERIRAYCELRDLELAEVVVDAGVSAYKALASREGGRRVLAMVRSRKVGAVVTLRLDRLFGNCADWRAVTEQWGKAGVALHLVDLGGQAVDTSSAMGRFFLTVMAGAAELERNQICEFTTVALAHKKSLGQRVGEVAYGFQVASDGKTLEPCQAEQEVIATVRQAAARGLSQRAIVAELASAGIVSRVGRPFQKTQVARMLDE